MLGGARDAAAVSPLSVRGNLGSGGLRQRCEAECPFEVTFRGLAPTPGGVVAFRLTVRLRGRATSSSTRASELINRVVSEPLQIQSRSKSNPNSEVTQASPPPHRAQTATRALGIISTPANLITHTVATMAGSASTAAGLGGLRGAAALSDSPLLGRLLLDLPAVFDAEVLTRLDSTARALLGRCGQACRVGPGAGRYCVPRQRVHYDSRDDDG